MSDGLRDTPEVTEVDEVQELHEPDIPPPPAKPTVFPLRGLAIAVGIFTLLGSALVAGTAGTYARLAPPLLEAMHPTIGELAMREGLLLEEAHAHEKAFTTYLDALEGRFHGPQNRAFTLYRLGMLQRERGLGADGPDYLLQAYTHPRCPVAAYEVVAHELLAAHSPETEVELSALFARWEVALSTPDERAVFYFYKGGHAQLLGRGEEAKALWLRGEGHAPGSPCAYALAEALAAEGAGALAAHYAGQYLLHARDARFIAQSRAVIARIAAPQE